jgi:Uma2 family endonuclease
MVGSCDTTSTPNEIEPECVLPNPASWKDRGDIIMSLMKTEKPATVADLLRMPKDGRLYELVDGEILVSPAGMRHSEIAAKIVHIIATYLEKRPIGKVFTENVGIALPNGNVRSPDVTFVGTEKLPPGELTEGFGELVPDLAVEVLSPSDRLKEVGRKIGEFLDCGVPVVWLVDPRRESVVLYRSLSDTQQFTADDTITGEPVLPGFSCKVAQFF